jgi:hypothetical protein
MVQLFGETVPVTVTAALPPPLNVAVSPAVSGGGVPAPVQLAPVL